MEWIAQGCGGVTVPGGLQGKVGPGTQGHGLVGDCGSRGRVGPDDLEGLFQPYWFYKVVILLPPSVFATRMAKITDANN